MKLKRCSFMLFIVAILCAAFGFVTSFAGDIDKVEINGQKLSKGDEITVRVNMEKCKSLVSAYLGSVVFDKNVLELVDVNEVKEGITYGKNSNSVKFTQVDAVNGIIMNEKTTLMTMTFKVISTQGGPTEIKCNMGEMYNLDKDNKKDVKVEDTNNTLSLVMIKAEQGNDTNDDTVSGSELDNIPKTADEAPLLTICLYLVAASCVIFGTVLFRKSNRI